jgi:hypothetical protein
MIVAQATLVKNNVIYVDAQEINQDWCQTHPAAEPPSDQPNSRVSIIVQSMIPSRNNDIENQSFDFLSAHNQLIRNERRNRFYCIFIFFCIGMIAIIVLIINHK